jgi:type II secretory pathway pseudopilin PulG
MQKSAANEMTTMTKRECSRRLGMRAGMARRAGITLIEICMAIVTVAVLCGGLYATGIKARQFAEHNRIATEARSLAKERIEEMISYGGEELAKPSCTLSACNTNDSSLGYPIVRRPRLHWHAEDGQFASATNAAYAEVCVEVTYLSPLLRQPVTDSFSTILEK